MNQNRRDFSQLIAWYRSFVSYSKIVSNGDRGQTSSRYREVKNTSLESFSRIVREKICFLGSLVRSGEVFYHSEVVVF